MRYCVLLFAALTCLLVLGACERASRQQVGIEEKGISIKLETAPIVATVGETLLKFTIFDEQNRPLDGASLAVKGDMSHAGMVPVLANTAELKWKTTSFHG